MKRGTKIIHNRIRCKICGEVLESNHVHDWVCCSCFKESSGTKGCFVDGGHEYRRIGGDPNDWEDLSETRPYTDEEVKEYNERQDAMSEDYEWFTPNYME